MPRVKRSLVDTSLPADQPLDPSEIKEMQRHLAFIKRHRSLLRLRLNAKEALLVEGTRPPSHRGTCQYLLSKIDKGTIRAALEREPVKSNPQARARFLADAAGISGDLDVLLGFLEALCASAGSADAGRAFTRAVGRIDFEEISAARLSRLLDVMQAAFDERELAGALFGLLGNPGFYAAFDRLAGELKPDVAQRFVPLRSVYEAIGGGGRRGRRREPSQPAEGLAEGLRIMFAAPTSMLAAYPLEVRLSLLDSALRQDDDSLLCHPGLRSLVETLPQDGEGVAALGLRVARQQVRAGLYEQARERLRQLRRSPRASAEVQTLLRWLEAPRRGPLALGEDQGPGLQQAFHLERLRPVVVRFAQDGQAERFAAERRLQVRACLPGVAAVLGGQEARDGFAAYAVHGRRLDTVFAERRARLSGREALRLALAGVRILRARGLAGLVLPDALPRRFVLTGPQDWGGIVLADLEGVRALEVEQAAAGARHCAAAFCRGALLFPPFKGKNLRREIPVAARLALERALAEPGPPWELEALLIEAMAG